MRLDVSNLYQILRTNVLAPVLGFYFYRMTIKGDVAAKA